MYCFAFSLDRHLFKNIGRCRLRAVAIVLALTFHHARWSVLDSSRKLLTVLVDVKPVRGCTGVGLAKMLELGYHRFVESFGKTSCLREINCSCEVFSTKKAAQCY